MGKDRQILDDDRNLARFERFHELVAMRVAAIEHAKVRHFAPARCSRSNSPATHFASASLDRVRDDPHLFTVFANGRQGILRNIMFHCGGSPGPRRAGCVR